MLTSSIPSKPALRGRLALAAAAALLVLSACGGADAPPPADPGTTTPAPPPTTTPTPPPPPPPAPTLTQQPASAAVTAGTSASFTVAATCTSGTLTTQWQRDNGTAGAFAALAGATALSYSLTPSVGDNNAQFRATLTCGGTASTTSNVATLTVTAPPSGGATLTALPVNGLRDQADIGQSRGIVREPSGSFAFVSGQTVRRLAADLSSITLIAGDSTAPLATTDGTGAAARFNGPVGIAVDGAGNLYVTENIGNTVRRITPAGVVTTIAGSGTATFADGTGSAASFHAPIGIAIGPDGDLYVADSGGLSNRIRRVTPAGVVTTYAGSGVSGSVDGPAGSAQFNQPQGIAVAADGTVYVSEQGRVRRIARSGSSAGAVSTFAGNGDTSNTANVNPADGTGTAAGIPGGGQLSLSGTTLYLRDSAGLVRAIDTATAVVTTVAGGRRTTAESTASQGTFPGFIDGALGVARLEPGLSGALGGVAAVGDGSLVITENTFEAVRRVDAAGVVTTIATSAASGRQPGATGVLAQEPLSFTVGGYAPIAIAPDGSVVLSQASSEIRRVAGDGSVSRLIGLPGKNWNLNGTGPEALLVSGLATAADAAGNVFFSDIYGVRRIAPNGVTTSVAGGTAVASGDPSQTGAVDGSGAAARFSIVTAIAPGANGELFVADSNNRAIRRIDAAGNVTTYAGALGQSGTTDGARTTARFTRPDGLVRGPDGTLWVLDGARGNAAATLRRIAPDGTVSTSTSLAYFIAVDPAGTVYAITNGSDLARVDPATGAFTTLIPANGAPGSVLGNNPRLGAPSALVARGVKQLVLIADRQLLLATLP